MPQYYLRIEAVNFDYSVYDTHDISTIRGGSFLLLDAFHGLETVPDIDIISTAASEALIAFSARDNAEASSRVDTCLDALSPDAKAVATFIHDYLPVPDDTPEAFQKCLKQLEVRCRRQQYRQLTFVLPECADTTRVCAKDGVRPAFKENDELLSTSVRSRRQQGKNLRQQVYARILGHALPGKMVDDLTELTGAAPRPALNGKLAFICLDGNRFGSIRDKVCTTVVNMHTFQKYLDEQVRKSSLEAVITSAFDEKNPSFRTTDGKARLETLLWGGDEVEWVVPAWQALNVLKLFYDHASRKFPHPDNSTQEVHLTYAAGVVFCHHKLPILKVREYAHQLCAIAKKTIPKDLAIKDITAQHNCAALLDMTAFDLIKGDVGEFLKGYHRPAQPEDLVLPIEALTAIEPQIVTLKQLQLLPRTKLHDLTAALTFNRADEIPDILKRVYTVFPKRKEQIERALAAIDDALPPAAKAYMWFLIADLFDYVGEDT